MMSKEALIKPTFIAHGIEEGVSPARFLSVTGAVDKLSFRHKAGTEFLFLQGFPDRIAYSGLPN
jgi:hypothetical protein